MFRSDLLYVPPNAILTIVRCMYPIHTLLQTELWLDVTSDDGTKWFQSV